MSDVSQNLTLVCQRHHQKQKILDDNFSVQVGVYIVQKQNKKLGIFFLSTFDYRQGYCCCVDPKTENKN
ncbi:hypothetical protein DERP_003869 [Dermatophagoides pteronyssinus]|uniref:HNH endonuclease n=1 Tax=Dermatophagoides pteronyssinus TaxID=6956 RepID=A0ABQ8J7I1_DERPT|nr:hypothetical protein DERP_003869 [Dermatophagoides pteronyssinus]